jgi:O-antigen chain-terminating methyltransferase
MDRQAEAMTGLRESVARRLDQFTEDWGIRLCEMSRRMTDTPANTAAALVGFDSLRLADLLRGSREEVRRQQARYVGYLGGQENILDAGCGRGEFLDLLRENGFSAYGVDSDESMVRYCRERGLDARNEDILEHLGSLPDESLGGLVAFQLIEHLDIVGLFQLLRLAARKIRPRGVLILETVNPTCLTTFSGAFYADPTHLRPIHPEAARRMAEIVGFGDAKIEFMNPIGDADKLQYLTTGPNADPAMRKIVETLNQNLRRINSLLYNYADYAVIGRKTV